MKSNSFLKQFVSLGIGSFIYLLVGLIGTPIITRLVDPVSYGDYSIFTVYSSLGLALCTLGLDQSFVRFFYLHESVQYRKRLLYACMMPAMAAAFLAGTVAVLGAAVQNRAGTISIAEILLIFINVMVLIINRYSTLSMRLKYETNLYSAVNIIQKGLFLILSIVSAMACKTDFYMILMLATIASTLIASMVGVIRERDLWRPEKCDSSCPDVSKSELIQYGIPLMFSASITLLFNALDKLALDQFCTRADVGVYTSALNLLAVFNVLRTSFSALWMPSAVEHYEKDRESKAYFQKGNSFITILMLLFGAGMIMCKDFFVMLLGEEYREAALIFPFLIFEPIMYTISETTVTGLVVTKKSGRQLIAAITSCATNFIGNWILTPRMGPQGAAISTGFSYIVFFAMRTVLSNRVYYVDYHLPKLALMTVLLALYAVYGSSHSFSIDQVVYFALFSGVLLIVYYKEIGEAVAYAKVIFGKMSGKA